MPAPTVKDVITDFLKHSGWWTGTYDQSIAACPWVAKYGTTENERAATVIGIMQESDRWLRRWFVRNCPQYEGLRAYGNITLGTTEQSVIATLTKFGWLIMAVDVSDPNMLAEVRVKSYKTLPQLSQYAKKLVLGSTFNFLEKTPYAIVFTKKNEALISPASFGSKTMRWYYFEAGGLMTSTTDSLPEDQDYLDMLVKQMMIHAFGYIQRDATEPTVELERYKQEMVSTYGQAEVETDLDVQGVPM